MLTFDDLWDLLITQDESQQIEVKKGSEVGKSCKETISAFSNEPGLGGGYLILGITDPSTVEAASLSGQSPNPNLDSSTVEAASLSGQSQNPNLDSSMVEAASLSGQSPNPNLDSSMVETAQLSLELFPVIKKESLEERLKKIGKRTEPQEIKALILELCELQNHSSSELASLLKRQRKYLLDDYLKPLIDEGFLEYTNPDKPTDPHQTYRTVLRI